MTILGTCISWSFCDVYIYWLLQPIWSEREASIEFLSPSTSSRSSQAPFYPQRVLSRILKPQKASKTWTTPVYLNSTADTDFSLDESLLSSSSDSEAENDEVIHATERGSRKNIPTRTEFYMLVVSSISIKFEMSMN